MNRMDPAYTHENIMDLSKKCYDHHRGHDCSAKVPEASSFAPSNASDSIVNPKKYTKVYIHHAMHHTITPSYIYTSYYKIMYIYI